MRHGISMRQRYDKTVLESGNGEDSHWKGRANGRKTWFFNNDLWRNWPSNRQDSHFTSYMLEKDFENSVSSLKPGKSELGTVDVHTHAHAQEGSSYSQHSRRSCLVQSICILSHLLHMKTLSRNAWVLYQSNREGVVPTSQDPYGSPYVQAVISQLTSGRKHKKLAWKSF